MAWPRFLGTVLLPVALTCRAKILNSGPFSRISMKVREALINEEFEPPWMQTVKLQ